MRIVLDTNVLISAIIHDGKPRLLLTRIIKNNDCVLVTSDKLLKEFVNVLGRSKFNLSDIEISEILDVVISTSDVKKLRSKLKVIKKDPDDDIVINTALDGYANYIVSGDSEILKIKTFERIQIVRVVEMLQLL